jgi:tyrosyl-tRNA synthetase
LKLDEQTLLDVFAGVPHFEVEKSLFEAGVKLADLTVDHTQVFPSKGEVKTLVKGGGVSVNKDKATAADQLLTAADLLDGKYMLIQQGKKKYSLIIAK